MVPITFADWAQIILTTSGILVTLVATGFAAFSIYSFFQLRDIRTAMQKQTDQMEVQLDLMLKASQKLLAGYERAMANDYDRAIQLYEEARAVFPKLYNVHNAIGWAYLGKGRADLAVQSFRQAKQARPQDVEPYTDLAYALIKADEPLAALRELEELLSKHPEQISYITDNAPTLYAPLLSNPRFQQLTRMN